MSSSVTCKRRIPGLKVIAIAVVVSASSALSQNSSGATGSLEDGVRLLGDWIGDSICQIKDSPCHDEKAMYRISRSKEVGKVVIALGKIVDSKTDTMAVLDFKYDKKSRTLISEYKHGVWKFFVNGNKMEGTLTTPEKVVYRRVSLKKVE